MANLNGPDGNVSSTASLQTIVLKSLLDDEPTTRSQLLQACRDDGFFYLEVTDLDKTGIDMTFLSSLGTSIFNVSQEEKALYDFKETGRKRTTGYKAIGTESGPFGDQDGFELFMLPYNETVVPNYPHPLICPAVVQENRHALAQQVNAFHDTGMVILRRLSDALSLEKDSELTKPHTSQEPSLSSLSFLRYPEYTRGADMVGHVAHTDGGSLTFLYSHSDGLQIYDADKGEWQFVTPRPHKFVVNVGDCLRLLTGGQLKSCLHRVIPHPDVKGTRNSFAYFMRPQETAILSMANGERWKSTDWHKRKMDVFAAPLIAQQEEKEVLLGQW